MTEPGNAGTMPIAGARQVLAVIGRHLVGRRLMLIGVLVALVIAAALGLATPWGLGRMVDIATGDVTGGGNAVLTTGVVMMSAAAGLAVFTGLGIALVGQLLETVLARLREQMITAGLRMPLGRVEAAGTGDLVSRATDDVSEVSIAIGRAVPALSTSVFAAILTMAGLGMLDWRFLVVVVITVPVYVVGLRMYLKSAPAIYAAERASMAGRAHQVLGAIRGLESVYAFGLSGQLCGRIAEYSWAVVRWSMRAMIVQNRLWGRLNFAEFLGMAAILIVGFSMVGDGSFTVGATTTAMLLYLQLFGPIRSVLLIVDDLQSAAASLGRIVGVIDEADRCGSDEVGGHGPAIPNELAVRADKLTFGYRADRPVLLGVSLTVRPGEHVAVVGSSGAGKTTLASLIAGVHRPDSGVLEVGARRVALVTQEIHVFSGALADDLRMAAPNATDDDLHAALRAVRAEDWVSVLPDGIATQVGAEGHELTPLQAQQVALARLVLMDPDLVILDEATAEAGSTGADALELGADAALRGRSAIIVAHRLSQAARADRVLVLDHGRMIEMGTHDELVRLGGSYARLWEAWARYR
jgi:ATP-binding cassette subfamily C protein